MNRRILALLMIGLVAGISGRAAAEPHPEDFSLPRSTARQAYPQVNRRLCPVSHRCARGQKRRRHLGLGGNGVRHSPSDDGAWVGTTTGPLDEGFTITT